MKKMNRMGYKVLSDSTLMSLNKKKLIELLRVAEHNYFVTGEALDISAEAGKKLIKHGHWIDKGVLKDFPKPNINVFHLLWCSECGAFHRARPYGKGGWINARYCPNCGAKMDLTHGLTHERVKGV